MSEGLFFNVNLVMAVTKEKKQEVLKKLDEKFGKAKAVYFSQYSGLSVQDMGKLRRSLRDNGVDFVVAKKTLMKLSLKNAGFSETPNDLMTGPVGVAFGYEDVVAPAKYLYEFANGADKLQLLGGFIDGKLISKEQALELAKLPSRDELLARLVGSMKAPISGLHGTLSGVMRKFVYALKAVSDKKNA